MYSKAFLFIICSLLIWVQLVAADDAEVKTDADTANVSLDDLTPEQEAQLLATGEAHEFQTEVNRLMDIIINSLYTQKEVCIRELISNSADALEKIRFMSVGNPEILQDITDLKIIVESDADAKTVSITDTGVGMTKSELINNLGTVAKSGTTNFLEAVAKGGDVNLIGQFGVGFYSAFLVADKVTVTSKSPMDPDQYIWQSAADARFTIAKDPRGNTLGRGTRITLHLKEDSVDLLPTEKLSDNLKKYSQFIQFPIYLKKQYTDISGKLKVMPDKKEEGDEDEEKEEDEDEVKVEEEDEAAAEPKEITRTELVHVNTQRPIWLRSKDDVSEKEYLDFYQDLTKNYSDEPYFHIHFSAEGEVEFKCLLYLPGKKPDDPYSAYFGTQQYLKLYVRRVLVADQFHDFIPKWMNFLRGIVDSDDLPLKVDREQLSQDKVMKVISKRISRKTIEALKKLSTDAEEAQDEMDSMIASKADEFEAIEDKTNMTVNDLFSTEENDKFTSLNETSTKFNNVWSVYSRNIKLGCQDDESNRDKIAKILRYQTTKSDGKYISLNQYVKALPEDKKVIYFITGETIDKMKKSPHLQIFLKKDIPVVMAHDTLDEPCLNRMGDFDGIKMRPIEKGEYKGPEEEGDEIQYWKKLEKKYEPLIAWWTENKFAGTYRTRLSKRLVDDPVCVVASEFGHTPFAENIMRYQTFADPKSFNQFRSMKVLEANPEHPIIKKLLQAVIDDKDNPEIKKIADNLAHAALLASGFHIEEPQLMAGTIYEWATKELGVEGESVEPVDVSDIPDIVEEEEPEEGEDEEEEDEEDEGGEGDANEDMAEEMHEEVAEDDKDEL